MTAFVLPCDHTKVRNRRVSPVACVPAKVRFPPVRDSLSRHGDGRNEIETGQRRPWALGRRLMACSRSDVPSGRVRPERACTGFLEAIAEPNEPLIRSRCGAPLATAGLFSIRTSSIRWVESKAPARSQATAGGPLRSLTSRPGQKGRANSWAFRLVADAKGSATGNC